MTETREEHRLRRIKGIDALVKSYQDFLETNRCDTDATEIVEDEVERLLKEQYTFQTTPTIVT